MSDLKWLALAIIAGSTIIGWQLHAAAVRPTEFEECANFVTSWNEAQLEVARQSAALRGQYEAAREKARSVGEAEDVARFDEMIRKLPVVYGTASENVVFSQCTGAGA